VYADYVNLPSEHTHTIGKTTVPLQAASKEYAQVVHADRTNITFRSRYHNTRQNNDIKTHNTLTALSRVKQADGSTASPEILHILQNPKIQ